MALYEERASTPVVFPRQELIQHTGPTLRNRTLQLPARQISFRLPAKTNMDQNIPVEAVDTRWPYRAGYPRLLRPSVTSKDIDKEANPIPDAKFEELKSCINTIIDAYNIPRGPHSPKVVYRAQKWGTSMIPRVIVDCVYEKGKSDCKMWAKAVTEIYTAAKLAAEEGREIGVELFDQSYSDTSHICTPPDSGSLKANWDEGRGYRNQILQLFENHPPMFQVMTPIGRCAAGWREYEWTTVILFDAMNAEDVAWDSLEEQMRFILPENIDIEIRQRVGPFFCGGDFGAVTHDRQAFDRFTKPPKPGCEISQQNNPEAGTMGGYVITEATDTNKRTTFGVTNAHVALASYKEASFAAPAGEGISIQSPGESIRKTSEAELLKDIEVIKQKIEMRRGIIEAVQESDPVVSDPVVFERFRNFLTIYEPELASLEEDLQLVQGNLRIGLVHNAELGYRDHIITETTSATTTATTATTTTTTARTTDKLLMDLALINMDCLADKRPQEIYWQENNAEPRIKKNTTCNFWDVDSLGNSQNVEKHIKVVSRLSRSGFYTRGIVNDFKAVTVFDEQDQPSLKGEAWVISCPRKFDSVAEMRRNQWLMGKDVYPFCRGGDSGSFVIAAADWKYDGHDNKITMLPRLHEAILPNGYSEQPFIVGLIFGLSRECELTYFIPFDAVKSEIEHMTGEKLVWPQKRSEALLEAEKSLSSQFGWYLKDKQ